jgi:SAM-dependent methyltransferase
VSVTSRNPFRRRPIKQIHPRERLMTETLTKVEAPLGLWRNHPSQSKIMPPDEAARYLLDEVAAKTGKALPQSDILDVGCGVRFACGIHNLEVPVKSYTGIDIEPRLIRWLKANIPDANLSFHFWPVKNPEYAPDGQPMSEFPGFPVAGGFDIITFFSVFTHLNDGDARIMLRFSKAVLNPGGRIFLTAFVDGAVENYQEGNAERPSLVSKYNIGYFENIVAEQGLRVESRHPAQKLMASHYVLAAA